MSGPDEETPESVLDSASPASDGPPSTPAPPSFGRADAPAHGRVEPEPEPEPEPERAAPSFAVPLFGPDKPWWAATPEDDEPEPEPAPAAGPEPEPAAPAEVSAPAVPEPPADEPEPGPAETSPPESPRPGTLVAGIGVPSVDTRGAVPADPIAGIPLPSYPDTDPDGIPLYPGPRDGAVPDEPEQPPGLGPAQPSEPELGPAAEAAPGIPHVQEPAEPPETEPEAGIPAEQPLGDAVTALTETRPDTPPSALTETLPDDDPGLEGALTPDAVLPPGVAPPEYTGPQHEGLPHTASATATDQLTDGGVILVVSQTPPEDGQAYPGPTAEQERRPPPAPARPPAEQPMVRRRNQLMIAMVAIVILIPVTVLAAFGLASGGGGEPSAAERPSRTAAPQPRRSTPAAPPPVTPRPTPVDINNERTDSRPLAFVEVFPVKELVLADRLFVQDKTSVNHQCGLAARGAMIQALETGECRSVVRATYVNKVGRIAVTAGVAAMPSHRAALTAGRAGDPAAYEWFRAMPGKRSPAIDRAGGHAAGTVRGRYIVYAYATYADGTVPKPGDPVLKEIAEEFIGYGLRPIDKRATGLS